jgi:hypothetical protein
MAGRFRAVETDLSVGAIAERFVGGLAAAAKGVLRLGREFFSFAIFRRIALGIGDNPLFAQRQAAADEIRAILGDFNLRLGVGALFHNGFTIAPMLKLSRASSHF